MVPRNGANGEPSDAQLRVLHGALLDIAAVLNRPQGDERLIREAAIPLERALFPLLVSIERFGPISIVELAERVGRDYTTVSRQVTKLETLELVYCQPRSKDRRVREATVTPKGKLMTDAVDKARNRVGRAVLERWELKEIAELIRLMRRFADAITDVSSHAAKI